MRNSSTLIPANIFNNPFDDINANTIDPGRILDFWCDPFAVELLKGMSAKQFAENRMPIILQGSRGSGKTTILKYFSYPVLKERANRRNSCSIIKQILEERSLGFYFRCDDSFVNTFQSIFKHLHSSYWLSAFEHYFELQLCSQILSVIKDFVKYDSFDEQGFIETTVNSSTILDNYGIKDLSKLESFIKKQLYYIDTYKNESIFFDVKFEPNPVLSLFALSKTLLASLNATIVGFDKVTYLILIDEFENLTEEMQMFINTKIKFSLSQITYRIGRRSEGTTTTKTINASEYLRKDHDYIMVSINHNLNESSKKKYFTNIATKRLNATNVGPQNINEILGSSENLDQECKEICKDNDRHIREIISERINIKQNPELYQKIRKIIQCPSNPIMETLNALWVIRRKEPPIEAATIAKEAMEDFIKKQWNENSKKYDNDYNNKYRYAITALLASIYKQDKLYYSFNTIVFIADGNTRTFLNICRAIFNDAWFYERDCFLTDHVISPRSQSRAIHEFSNSEFEGICSIIDYGNSIRNLLLNIGNTFSLYHKDKKARYPETTQFSFDLSQLSAANKKVIDTAISWTMIIKREKKQRLSMSINHRGDIYYINRAFAPLFNISYRIRGGYNVRLSANDISNMINEELLDNEMKYNKPKGERPLTLFDYDYEG